MKILSASKKKAVFITKNHGKFIAEFVQFDQENQREHLKNNYFKLKKQSPTGVI
jgi:hypothetical protein